MKTITFTVPCYNSAEYMDKCINSLIPCDEGHGDIEILIVDDGSANDNTAEKADEWEKLHPGMIRALHKQNGGHGSAVNMGLENATGLYFKVVDSDDWLDDEAMKPIMAFLREQRAIVENSSSHCDTGDDSAVDADTECPAAANASGAEAASSTLSAAEAAAEDEASVKAASEGLLPVDLVIGDYVYEKVYENSRTIMDYKNVFPVGRTFTWEDIHHFHASQYLLMHSVIYRTQMLRDIGLRLPEHCFYVDNIFVYVPLPAVKTIHYFDVDMYRYFIGREGQSVNEDTMMKRIDQQLKVTRFMIDAIDTETQVPQKKLCSYMEKYMSMMMCINSVFLRMINTEESDQKLKDIWAYLKKERPDMYPHIRKNVLNVGTNLPSELGRRIGLGGYHLAQKIFKFN